MKTCDIYACKELTCVLRYSSLPHNSYPPLETDCKFRHLLCKSFHNKCNYVHPLVCMCLCEGLEKKEKGEHASE